MIKKVICLISMQLFALILCLGFSTEVFASSYTQLQQAEKEKQKTESKIDNTQNDIDNLNQERVELQDYLDQLNNELTHTTGELAGIQSLIAEKEASLIQMQEDLQNAKIREAEQYVAMKRRIKFMYEKGDSAYLELFFHAESFADFLNKTEYVERLSQYDRDMLKEYSGMQEKIRVKEQALVDERVALGSLQDEALAKQNEVAELVSQASTDVAQYQDQISDKEAELLAYEAKLEESENDIATLRKKIEEENALTQQAMAAGFSDLSSITFATGDLDLLAAIIYCEAGNQPYVGQVAVGNVVMNRVKSAVFPNTVLEVIYQNKQFSPVGSGRFAIALANHKATPACYAAAQDAMNGSAPVGNCLFFRTPIPGLTGIQIGGHIFY